MDRRRLVDTSGARRLRRWLPVFAGALVVRLLYWAVVFPDWVPQADADQYVRLARNLAAGLGFAVEYPQLELHPTAFRPPLYPAILTPGAWLFGEALWPARLLQAVLGSVVVVLAGVLTARIGGRRTGVLAAATVAVYPPLLANDTVTLTEPLALALLLAAVLLVDDRRWALAGTAAGLLLLTRPNGYLVILILAGWAVHRVGRRRGVALAGIAALVLFPWLVRNRVQVGTWRPTTSDGFTLSAVYGLPSQRAGHFVDPVWSPAYGDAHHRFARFDEAGWNELLTDEAVDAVRADPGYVRYMVWRNFRGYFEIEPGLNDFPEVNDGRHMGFRRRTLPVYGIVTALGLVGVLRALRHRRDARLVVLTVLVAQYVALSLLLVAPPRLRAPFDLWCCVGLGLLVGGVADRWSLRRRPVAM